MHFVVTIKILPLKFFLHNSILHFCNPQTEILGYKIVYILIYTYTYMHNIFNISTIQYNIDIILLTSPIRYFSDPHGIFVSPFS